MIKRTSHYVNVLHALEELVAEKYQKFIDSERKDKESKEIVERLTQAHKLLEETLKLEINTHQFSSKLGDWKL